MKLKLYKIETIDDKGRTLHIFDGPSAVSVEKDVQKAMKKGATIRRQDGTKEWIDHHVILDTTKKGSKQYTWDKAGEKVKHKTVHIKIDIEGKRTEQIIGKTFRKF